MSHPPAILGACIDTDQTRYAARPASAYA